MTDTEAFSSFLLGLVVAYRRPDVDHGALAQHMTTLMTVAAPRFRSMGANKPTVDKLLAIIERGNAASTDGMPSLAYARLLAALRKEMRPAVSAFSVHPDVSEVQARTVRALLALLTPDTATVTKKDDALNRLISVIPDRYMRVAYAPVRPHNQQANLRLATRLVQKMVGRDDSRLAPTETKEAKARHPETYKRYLAVRRDVASAYQNFVRDAARQADGPVHIGKVVRDMKRAGISYHPFDGLESLYVNEDMKLHTPKPHRLMKAMPAPGSTIVMNPRYDPKTDDTYVFKFRVPGSKRDASKFSAAYTRTYVMGRKDQRFDLVTKAAQEMPRLRPRWLRDLKSSDPTTRRLAAMTEILYSQAMRVGAPGNAVDGVPTFGLSTLLVNHIVLRNGTAILQYAGKDAIQQKHVISGGDREFPENARVLKILAECVRGKRGADPLWTDSTGRPITASDVRAYMKGKKLPIDPHKFRHIAGTQKMAQMLEALQLPKNTTQQQAEKAVKNAAIQVGMLLGHVSGDKPTAGTSIKSYISPGLIASFFRERGLRIPQWVPAAGRGSADD